MPKRSLGIYRHGVLGDIPLALVSVRLAASLPSPTRGEGAYMRLSLVARVLQIPLPGLADQIDTEAVVLLFLHELEACALIDATRGDQDALRPQRHLAVAPLARILDALLDQRAADTESPRFLFHLQQPQLGNLVRGLDQKDRADRLAAHFRNPAVLARGVIVLDELCADFGDQGLVADIPVVVGRIGGGLPGDDPAHVADAMAAQHESRRLASTLQHGLDGRHSLREPRCIAGRKLSQHCGDLILRAQVQLGKSLAPLGGEAELVLPAIRGQGPAGDQALFVEALHDPAEIAGVEAKFVADLFRGKVVPVREFVEHAGLAERERALAKVLVEHAKLAGVEAVEGADRCDVVVGRIERHGSPRYLPLSNNYLTLESIVAPQPTMTIRLRSMMRDERPSRRSSRASEWRA